MSDTPSFPTPSEIAAAMRARDFDELSFFVMPDKAGEPGPFSFCLYRIDEKTPEFVSPYWSGILARLGLSPAAALKSEMPNPS